MKNVRDARQNVKSYLNENRPKRQRVTGYIAFFIIMLFAAFVYGTSVGAEKSARAYPASYVYASDVNLSDNTSKEVEQYSCSLPEIFPNSDYQNNWENLLTHCQIIEDVADRYENMDPKLVAAVIMVESGGDFRKLSKVGAVGLMQVMPSDGYSGDTWGFPDRPITYDLFDPKINITEGVRILNDAINNAGDLWKGLYNYVGGHSEYPDWVLNIYQSLLNQ